MKSKIYISYKDGILDPQGQTVQNEAQHERHIIQTKCGTRDLENRWHLVRSQV